MELALRGIEKFSHLWILFHFHDLKRTVWKPLVAPPRLGGKRQVGAFATRSPYRPNPIGMSVVKLVAVQWNKPSALELIVEGGDFQQDTPILDIKPYVVYADSFPTAQCAWADLPEKPLSVVFSEESEAFLAKMLSALSQELRTLIQETLSLDPRPGYERAKPSAEGAHWGMVVLDHEIKWTVKESRCSVYFIERVVQETGL
jgi:tRNA-Thr(GGU) m(6)t(6)A37 methyltransferase TsaA